MLNAIDKLLEIDLENAKDYFESRELNHVTNGRRIVIRLDGVSFKVRLREFKQPRDERVRDAMEMAARELMNGFGAPAAYIVSDEINLFLGDYTPFGGREFKLVSISSSMASAHVTAKLGKPLFFDSRVINLEPGDELRYITWRARLAAGNYLSNFGNGPFKESVRSMEINYLDCCGKILSREWTNEKPSKRVIREYLAIDVIARWHVPSLT